MNVREKSANRMINPTLKKLSLLSLTWSTTSLEKARRHDKKAPFGITVGFCFVLWQFFTLTSRLSVIVMLAHVFRGYVFIFLGIHCFLQSLILFILQIVRKKTILHSLSLSLLASVLTIFHVSEIVHPTKYPTTATGYYIILSENIAMMLALLRELPNAPHMDVLEPIAIAVIMFGSLISYLLSGVILVICSLKNAQIAGVRRTSS